MQPGRPNSANKRRPNPTLRPGTSLTAQFKPDSNPGPTPRHLFTSYPPRSSTSGSTSGHSREVNLRRQKLTMGSLGDEPQELADIVWGLCRTNGPGFGNREFLPASTYKDHDLLNENVLRAELGILPGEDDPLVQFILGFATKIFLALLSRAWDIDTTRDFLKNFMKTGFMDEMLPVNLEFCNSSPSFRSKGWTLGRRKNFCDSQWLHLAPVISETTFTFNLEPRQPLPFFTAGESSQEIGGSCLVHRVQIHEDHLFNPPRDVGHPFPPSLTSITPFPKLNTSPAEQQPLQHCRQRNPRSFPLPIHHRSNRPTCCSPPQPPAHHPLPRSHHASPLSLPPFPLGHRRQPPHPPTLPRPPLPPPPRSTTPHLSDPAPVQRYPRRPVPSALNGFSPWRHQA